MTAAAQLLRDGLYAVPWLVALAWAMRAAENVAHLRAVPDLSRLPAPGTSLDSRSEAADPVLSVIIPACNEQAAIESCVRSALASQGLPLEVIAVDDRSTDATPAILDALAVEFPGRLRVLHLHTLPEGWLGKPHALDQGARLATAPFLLFTDADMHFAPTALLRAVRFAEENRADHLIALLTPDTHTFGERMVLSALQTLAFCALRLWRIPDPRARETLGVGSFTLLRRAVYEQIGGWSSVRMEVLEDIRLGWEIKHRWKLRQRVVFATGLLSLHWGEGIAGLVRNFTKNGFAITRYRTWLAVLQTLAGLLFLLAPIAALGGPIAVQGSFLVFAAAVASLYALGRRYTGISPWYVLLFPVGGLVLLFAIARSVVLTLARGGVVWRGTLYPLAVLRKAAGPLR